MNNTTSAEELNLQWEKAKELQENYYFKDSLNIYERLLPQVSIPEMEWAIRLSMMGLYHKLSQLEKIKEIAVPLDKIDLPPHYLVKLLMEKHDLAYSEKNRVKGHELIKQAYEIAQKHCQGDPELLGKVVVDFGHSFFFNPQPEYDKGIKILEEQLEIYLSNQESQASKNLLSCYFRLVKGYYYIGDLIEAENYFKKGCECYPRVQDHISMGGMHLMYFFIAKQRSTVLASELLEKATSYFQKAYKEEWKENETFGYVHIWRAELASELGDFSEALYYIKQAIPIAERSDLYIQLAIYTHSSTIYLHLGKEEQAIEFAKKYYELVLEKMPDSYNLIAALGDLSEVYINQNFSAAFKYAKEALDLLGKLELPKSSKAYYPVYKNLFNTCTLEEQAYYEKRLLDYSNEALLFPLPKASVQNIIGKRYLQTNSEQSILFYEGALRLLLKEEYDLFTETINWADHCLNYHEAWQAITGLAEAHIKRFEASQEREDLEKTVLLYQHSVQILQLIQNSYKAEGSKLIFNEQLPITFGLAIKTIKLLNKENAFSQIFHFIEVGKAQVLQGDLTEGRARKSINNLPLFNQEKDLRGELQALEIKLEQSKGTDKAVEEKLYDLFFSKRKAYQTLIQEMEEAYPEYKRLKYQNAILPLEKIREQLSENQILLNYFLSDQTLYIQYISEEEIEIVTVPCPKGLPQLVHLFVESIRFIKPADFYQYAHQLSQILIQPVADLILDIFGSETLQQLIIIPHSYLGEIPFEALFTSPYIEGREPDYLINDFDVSYHYSASLWVRQQQNKREKSTTYKFLGMAPVYEEGGINPLDLRSYSEKMEWQHLPFSEIEVTEISQLFKTEETKCFIKKAASKTNFLAEAPTAEIIHLAAHFHQHERPKLSGLVFYNDEKLYIDEAFNLDLNANLFVLSACESAVGEMFQSEGMMAINRGLLYSGVQNTISTLFVLNDASAYKVMSHFYKALLEGKAIHEALGIAKRKTLENETLKLPIYWSSFILIGK